MYCSHCGMKNEDDSLFCRQCGAPLQPGPAVPQSSPGTAPEAPKKPKKSHRGLIITLVVVLVLAVAGAAAGWFLSGWEDQIRGEDADREKAGTMESAVADYYKIMNGEDGTIGRYHPEGLWDAIMESHNLDEDSIQEEIGEMEMGLKEEHQYLKQVYGSTRKKYTITGDRPLDLDIIRQGYRTEAPTWDGEVTDAVLVVVEVKISGSKDSITYTEEIPLVKVDGSWYIDFIHWMPIALCYQ